ncbi:MAG: cupin [Ferruginibacter sp.]|nr:cupin [Ferruginibacter sp.]
MALTQKRTALMLITCIALFATACKNNQNQLNMTKDNLFQKGEKLGNEYFTGNAFLKPLLAKDKNNEFTVGSVTFEPGARTIWHTLKGRF